MKMTKNTLIALAAVAGALALQSPARAAEEKEAAKPAASDRLGVLHERLEETAKELNLTDEQKGKMQDIIRERLTKLRDLRQDNSLSGAEKLEKVKAMQKELAPKVKKVLDAEQYAKWEKKAKQWLEEMGQRVGGKK